MSGGDPSSGVTNSASEAAEAGKENSAPKKDAATSESPSSSTSQSAEQYVYQICIVTCQWGGVPNQYTTEHSDGTCITLLPVGRQVCSRFGSLCNIPGHTKGVALRPQNWVKHPNVNFHAKIYN